MNPDLAEPISWPDIDPPPGHPVVLVTVKEAGRMLGVGRTTAYQLIANGELEVVHIGRCARVPVSSILGLVEVLRSRNAS